MNNTQHLIENAIDTFKHTGSYDKASEIFKSGQVNIEMSKQEGLDLDKILDMAQYVYCRYIDSQIYEAPDI